MKPLVWVGSALKDLKDFPDDVRSEMGYALFEVQCGLTPLAAKPLAGFGGATVLEIVENYNTDTYRAVYTVKFKGVIYVLHSFQKKSTKGIKTPQRDIELIKNRLQRAEELHKAQTNKEERCKK